MLALQVDVIERFVLDLHEPVHVGDEIRQRVVDAVEFFARETAPHRRVGPHAEKDGIVFVEQFLEGLLLADARIQHEFHAHAFEQLAPLAHDVFLELERRDPEREQAADLRVGVIHDGTNALACEYVGRSEPRRPRADDRHALAGIDDVRHVGPPAGLDGFVGDVAFDVTDADRADAVVERARALAKPVLRADPAADLGQ